MSKKIKGFFTKEIASKIMTFLLLSVLLISLWPILRIAYYAHPSADDFTYGLHAHQTYVSTGSLMQTLQSAKDTAIETYHTWQGTFSSVFLMALNPAVFNESIYWITPFIVLGGLFLGLLCFLWVLLTEVFSFEKRNSFNFILVVLLASIQNFYWPAQGIYWFNASIHYTFMFGMMLLMLACSLHALFVEKKWKYVTFIFLSSIFAVLCGGSNFPVALISVLLFSCILFYAFLIRKKKSWGLLIPALINWCAFVLNIIAPGNAVRSAHFVQMSPLAAVKSAMGYMFVAEYEWFTVIILLLTIVSVPIAWDMVSRSKFDFKYPGVISILSYLCCAAMCTPSFYSTSEEPLARVINVIRLMYHLLLFVNVFYWTGWVQKRNKVNVKPMISIGMVLLVITIGVVDFNTTEIPQTEYISYGAYCSLITEEAVFYHQDYLKRKSVLESSEMNVELEPFRVHPFPFWTYDISDNSSDWKNVAIARWYNKESVVLKQE